MLRARVISDECVSCGSCEAECPVGAISEGAEHFEIDADSCVDCGACAAQCPMECIAQGEDKYVIDPEQCISCGTCADIVHIRRLHQLLG